MRSIERIVSMVFITCLVLAACAPQSAPDPTEAAPSVPTETGTPALVNALYYRQGSGIFAERTGGESLTLAHYMWLTPNGMVLTVVTPLDQDDGVCGDIYSISTTWNDDPDTINAALASATGTYTIDAEDIALDWSVYGVSYNGTYAPGRLTLDVNGRAEDFILAGSGPEASGQVWFPEDCVYDKWADSGIPDPYIDSSPSDMWNLLDLYTAVMLQNGMLMLSFEGENPVPSGNYWIGLHAEQEEEEVQTFECQVLKDYPNRLYCFGAPLEVGMNYQVAFMHERAEGFDVQDALEADYFDNRSTSLPPFDFSRISGVALEMGMSEVKTIGQAWGTVGQCVELYMSGDTLPKGCEEYIVFAMGLLDNGYEDPFFFDDPILAMFDDPILAFDDPILAMFDDPILAYEDPFFFDDPILAYEDPFFFDDPILAYEDPFFFDDPILAYEDPFFLKNLASLQANFASGTARVSSRGLGINCGQALKFPYSSSLGEYTNQVYASALSQHGRGNNLPDACEALIIQCDLTPGSGCFMSPGALGWTWSEGETPRTTEVDCSGEDAGSFYCQSVRYEDAGLYTSGRSCGKEVRWGNPLRYHGQYADLMFYLASVTPWLPSGSLPETCQEFLTQGMHSLYGISPIAIWGSNGTSFTAYGLPMTMTMPVPSSGVGETLKPIVPGGGGGAAPTMIPWVCFPPLLGCPFGQYWDTSSCSCKIIN